MSKENNLTDFLTDVADAIREKKGTAEKINPQNFSEEIRSIESGSTEVEDAIVKRTVTSYSNTRITSVGTNAFRTCGYMKTIHIPSVHTLGTFCLSETGLINVVLPSVRILGSQVFRSCTFLRSVHLEYDGQISISNQAFYMSTLTCIVIKSSYMATLGTSVFSSTNIANGTGYIYVPDNLVEDYKSATNWSAYADQIKPLSEYVYLDFADPVVEKICAENFGDDIGTTQAHANAVTAFPAIFQNNTEITSFDEFEYFENVKSIYYGAFQGCTSMTSVTFPSNLKSIDGVAFSGCSSLSIDVDLPNLKTIGIMAFNGTAIRKVSSLGSVTSIGTQAFSICKSLTEVNLPDTELTIGNGAFNGCLSLTTINLHDKIVSIGQTSFNGCPISGTLNLPNLESIGMRAFQQTQITEVASLGKITTLTEYAFYACKQLQKVRISSLVENIGQQVLNNCSNLQTVIVERETPAALGDNVFGNTHANLTIYVPNNSVDAYKIAWSAYAGKIKPLSEYQPNNE